MLVAVVGGGLWMVGGAFGGLREGVIEDAPR